MPQSTQKHKMSDFRKRGIKQRLKCAIMFFLKPTAIVGRKLEGTALHSLLYNNCIEFIQNTVINLHSSTGTVIPKCERNSPWKHPLPNTRHEVALAATGPVLPLHHEHGEVARNRSNWHLYMRDFKSPTRPPGLWAEGFDPHSHLPWTKALPHLSSILEHSGALFTWPLITFLLHHHTGITPSGACPASTNTIYSK